VIICGVIVALVVAAYIAGMVYFRSHFIPGTTVDNVAVGGQTTTVAAQNIKKAVSDYSLHVTGEGNLDFSYGGDAAHLTYKEDQAALADLASSQNLFKWPMGLLGLMHFDLYDGQLKVNQAMLDSTLEAMDFMDPSQMVAPTDATYTFDPTQGKYVVKPEQFGTELDVDQTLAAIQNALCRMDPNCDLIAAGVYVQPQVLSTNKQLLAQIKQYNKYVKFEVSYVSEGKQVSLDAGTTIGWVNTKKKAKGQKLDQTKLKAWVAGLAKQFDTVGALRSFVDASGDTVTVKGGTFGNRVDQAAEVKAINAAYKDKTATTRAPLWSQEGVPSKDQGDTSKGLGTYVPPAQDPGSSQDADGQDVLNADWGNTDLEVDLTKQKLWYFQDGVQKLTCNVVTGNNSIKGRRTPTGVYYVSFMDTDYTMKGPATDPYESFCHFVMRWKSGGYYLHDASWRYSFGGSIYEHDGSHGCVNMPPASAEALYKLITLGCPVIIHK
jgi:lipoprotein-anchoring transpeptidase ErfK/SrfK